MRRRWKIASGILLVLILAGGGLFTWMILKPNPPATIVEPGPTGRRVAEGSVFGNFYPAAGAGRRPGILLLGGSEGGLGTDVHRQALLLQQGGYNVLHLGYFNVPGLPSKLENVPLERFHRGLDWLKARPEVEPASLAIMGYSKGAEAALLTATSYPGIRAVVAGMPSSVAWDGMSARSYLFGGVSGWTRNGRPLPSVAYGPGDSSEHLLPRFANALDRLEANSEAIIPVERFRGRLLMVCGERDSLWPACRMARMIAARARAAGRPDVRLAVYPEAGHGVMGAPLPATDRVMRGWATLGGTAEANAEGRARSWRQIVEFLAAGLRTDP